MVILNKTDLVGPVHLEVIREWIGEHLTRIRIIEAVRCEVPLDILLAVGHFDPANAIGESKNPDSASHDHTHKHLAASSDFETWSYTSDQPFCIDTLREMVRRELPASIYRCKGIVFTTDVPERRVALQTVGRRTEISELDEWGERSPLTQIVAIGAGIDAQELDEKFAACIARP